MAGLNYLKYVNQCTSVVRQSMKEPYKSQLLNAQKVHFKVTEFDKGKKLSSSTFHAPPLPLPQHSGGLR